MYRLFIILIACLFVTRKASTTATTTINKSDITIWVHEKLIEVLSIVDIALCLTVHFRSCIFDYVEEAWLNEIFKESFFKNQPPCPCNACACTTCPPPIDLEFLKFDPIYLFHKEKKEAELREAERVKSCERIKEMKEKDSINKKMDQQSNNKKND